MTRLIVSYCFQELDTEDTIGIDVPDYDYMSANEVLDFVMGAIEATYHEQLDDVPYIKNIINIGPKKVREPKTHLVGPCNKAPAGWECTRQEGHDGPCAAYKR